MFKFINTSIFASILLFTSLEAHQVKNFQEAFQGLDNVYPTVLDLKIHVLDVILRMPKNCKEKTKVIIDETFFGDVIDDVIIESAFDLGDWYATCEKDINKIIFTIHLPFEWEKENEKHLDGKNQVIKQKYNSRDEIIEDKFNQIVLLTQQHVHKSFSSSDALFYFMAPLKENGKEELILKYENGIPVMAL